MTSGGNNFKLCPSNFLIFVPPEDFCDAFCVAGGAFGPCSSLLLSGLSDVPKTAYPRDDSSSTIVLNYRKVAGIYEFISMRPETILNK